MKNIYLDNAATTPIAPEAVRAYVRAAKNFANPSSFNDAGRSAADLLADTRTRIVRVLQSVMVPVDEPVVDPPDEEAVD